MNAEATKLVEQAVARLGEHFTSVHIMVSCQERGGTSSLHRGAGDWYARQGLAHEFINADKASAVQGYTEQMGVKKGLAQLQDFAAQAAERQADANASQNAGQFLSNYLQAPGQGGVPANSDSDGDGQGNDVPATPMDPLSRE